MGGLDEIDILESYVKLTASEAERVRLISPAISDGGLKLSEDELKGEFEAAEYLNWMNNQSDEPKIPEEVVSDALNSASARKSDFDKILEEAASEVANTTGLNYLPDMDPEKFLSAVSQTDEVGEFSVSDSFIEGMRKAEEESEDIELSDAMLEKMAEHGESLVYRDEDRNGKRVYRWPGGSAYSVTTILDPLPSSHLEIDTGGGLFYWKKKIRWNRGEIRRRNCKRLCRRQRIPCSRGGICRVRRRRRRGSGTDQPVLGEARELQERRRT